MYKVELYFEDAEDAAKFKGDFDMWEFGCTYVSGIKDTGDSESK